MSNWARAVPPRAGMADVLPKGCLPAILAGLPLRIKCLAAAISDPSRAVNARTRPLDRRGPIPPVIRATSEELLDVLCARTGLVCAVGAGGKKSTLYRLAMAHLQAGTPRIGLTTTVTMAPPPRSLAPQRLIADAPELRCELPTLAARHRLVMYAQPSSKPGRVGGLPPGLIPELHTQGGFTVTLIKADGARMRWLKAPRPGEPVLPPRVTTVLPLVSARALGQPLGKAIAHRLERVVALTGAEVGEPLQPVHLARFLAGRAGGLQGVGEATVVPVINMVDDPTRLAGARAAAEMALGMSERFDRVVLAAMVLNDPVVEVVAR